MGRRYETVSFLTDYGLIDEFVGVVKSVIRDLAPHVVVVDISHDIPPFDVRAGALTLARSVQYMATGVVLAVVDPGVGTSRRAIAIEVAGGNGVFIGPDNGLLAGGVAIAGGAERAVELTNESFHLAAPGATFAGRDVFAPVTAHLSNGVDLAEFGNLVSADELLPGVVPLPRPGETGSLITEVMWVDRFGNAQLNVGLDDLESWGQRIQMRWGNADVRSARKVRAYGELGDGELGLVLDSYGMFSVSLNRSAAAAELSMAVGTEVTLFDLGSTVTTPPATPVALGRRPERA